MPKPIRRIGASKLAVVSECQTPQGTHVALKEYNRQSLTAFQHERIFAAAQGWRELTIPGLVPYLEVAPEQNQIVMELFDRSAAIRLSEGHSDPRLVLHALRGILAALAQLHEQGWLHVNLKPTNVFFDGDGRARLSDGLMISTTALVTLPPPTSQKYLTPEHTSDAFGPMTAGSDLYTVGFMALELLAGDRFGRAFQGIGDDAADDDLAWFQWHGSSQEAPSATTFSKTCPAELANVIARLVAKQPAVRYNSARQALQDLPQDISLQPKSPTLGSGAPQSKREALSTHVVERPATGIVLAIASGARAGEMIGTNDNELLVGFDHDCFLRFSSEHYPQGGGKVLLRRGSEGWYVLRVSGDAAFVNQRLLEEKFPLRSGDIVRLSSRGPDVQFTMQSGGVAIRALVERFLPKQLPRAAGPSGSPAAPRAGLAGPPGRAGVAAGAALGARAPQPGAAPAPLAAAGQTPAGRPSSQAVSQSAGPRAATTVQPSGSPGQGQAPLAPARPVSPPRGPSAPVAPQRQPAVAKPIKAANLAQVRAAPNAEFSWLAPKTWNKNQKNTVVAVVGGLLVLLLVFLFPSPAPPTPAPADSAAITETNSPPDAASQPDAATPAGDMPAGDTANPP